MQPCHKIQEMAVAIATCHDHFDFVSANSTNLNLVFSSLKHDLQLLTKKHVFKYLSELYTVETLQ